jgi:HPr kinase/phosphorylase
MTLHASCATRDGAGVLLTGPPGAGKSDLLLRLLDHGFTLVADDQVEVARAGASWVASAPAALAGLLEVRGLGLCRMPWQRHTTLALVVRLGEAVRLPMPETFPNLGLPTVDIVPWHASAPHRVALALECAIGRVTQIAGAFAA